MDKQNSKAKTALINFCVLAAALVLCLGLLEIVFRYGMNSEKERSSITKEWQEKYVKTNRLGYRDKEYAYEKPQGVFRILVLGDSQTFGQGVERLEDTWPKKLEEKLNAGLSPKRFEVLNVSGPGWNSDTQLYQLYRFGLKFDPDLVLLAYYHNDIPMPLYFECDSSDRTIFPEDKTLDIDMTKLEVYRFLKFRFNRALEKLGRKPTFAECVNKLYESRGWDMGKIYLDTMNLTAGVKNIHFMISVLPVVYELNENYPFNVMHSQMKKYCRERGIYCVDLFEEGFRGLDADDVAFSKVDRHFNEKGAEVVAQTLFEKVGILKSYQNLDRIHRIFSIQELLGENKLATGLDARLSKADAENSPVKLSYEEQTLIATEDNSRLSYERNFFKTGTQEKEKTVRGIFDSSKKIFEIERIFFDGESGKKAYEEKIERENENYKLTAINALNSKSPETVQRNFTFKHVGKYGGGYHLEIEKDISFSDPKVLEPLLFSRDYNPAKHMAFEDVGKLMVKMFKDNPRLGDWRKARQMSKPETLDLFNQKIYFQDLLTFKRYDRGNYLSKLIRLIVEKKPSRLALQAVEDFESFVGNPP